MQERPLLLVVDDLPQNVEVIGEFLADDYEVQCAFSGAEALTLAAETVPELILLDVMMPEMNGYQVCDALKADPRTAGVPIIFVTAKSDAESETLALSAGGVDFIHKPVNRDVVRARVRLHLALCSRERELRQLNAALEQRVAERTEALRDALVRAGAAHAAKSLFLANVSHELRTPMNAIMGLSAILERRVADPRVRDRIDQLGTACRDLLGLVEHLIDIADLQAARVRIDYHDFRLEEVLEGAVAAWRTRAEAKGLVLEQEFDPALPAIVRGDAGRLGQIVGQLLGNAVKFTEHGHIRVRAWCDSPIAEVFRLHYEVADEGVGIPQDRQAVIFDPFEQADNSSTRRFRGAGLGLAICKQLVELMGGRIGVDSTPGQGSRFWIVIPLGCCGPVAERSPAPAEAIAQTDPSDLVWSRAQEWVVPLAGLLAARDLQAITLWARAGQVLEAALGDQAGPFNRAMEDFDFDTALDHLRSARAAHPARSPFE